MWHCSKAHHRPSRDHRVERVRRCPSAGPRARAAAGTGSCSWTPCRPRRRSSMSPARMRLVGQHDGLQSRSADLVDRQRGDVIGQSAAKRGLPRGILSQTRADDVAHDALVDDRRRRCRRGAPLRPRRARQAAVAFSVLSAPRNFPVGVRTAETMTEWFKVQGSRFRFCLVRSTFDVLRSRSLTLSSFTVSGPSSVSMRRRMIADARRTSCAHCGLRRRR